MLGVRSLRHNRVALGMALLVCGGPLVGAVAQIATNSEQPIQIQADSGIEWQQNARIYIARGNAVATRGDSQVHADTLIAHYREAKGGNVNTANMGGNTEIYRVEAEGHVTLQRNAQTVAGDRAVYDVDRSIAVVTGKQLKLATASDTVTARDSLEWYDQRQIAVARGDAVAVRNGKTIKADVLTAYIVKTAPGQQKGGSPAGRPATAHGKSPVTPAAVSGSAPATDSKISRVDAQGHVVVSNPPDIGRGDFGVYNATTGIATLIGNVVIERGKDVIRGQRGVMDLNKNVSRLMPGDTAGAPHQRVQGLFVHEDQGGRPAAAAAAGKKP